MLQSLRRVFVGSVVAMIFSVTVGIYMGTVLMGERCFQPLVILGLTIPGLMWSLIAVMVFGINESVLFFVNRLMIWLGGAGRKDYGRKKKRIPHWLDQPHQPARW